MRRGMKQTEDAGSELIGTARVISPERFVLKGDFTRNWIAVVFDSIHTYIDCYSISMINLALLLPSGKMATPTPLALTTVTATTTATITSLPSSTATSPHPTHTILPGLPNSRDYSGPWFRTQLLLSLSVGISSWLIFTILRRRWRRIYMPRALLHAADPVDPASVDKPGIFGWIVPTWRVSDRAMLDTVGLDAVVFLDFMKTSAVFFGVCAVSAAVVLMPVNWTRHGSTDSDTDVPGNDDKDVAAFFRHHHRHVDNPHRPSNTTRNPTLLDIIIDPQTTTSLHLLFTYFFSLLALYLFHRNYHRFLAAKQTFSISRKSSVPARTVLVSAIPAPLRSERALKEYFDTTCGWPVESVQVVRHVGADLREAIKRRDRAMRSLERAWWEYKGDSDTGRIRLDGQGGGEDVPSGETSGEESRVPTAQTSRAASSDDLLDPFATRSDRPSSPAALGHTPGDSIEVPVVIDDPEDPSPNWGELRTTHDLPTTGHPFAIAVPPEEPTPNPPNARPTTRLPSASLPLSLPLLGTKVDAISHWQAEFDAAERLVRKIRKAHEADWKSDVSYARAEVDAGREGETPVDSGTGERETGGWLSGWMAAKDDDQGFARVRLTEEGRARVSDSENGDVEDEEDQEGGRPAGGAMSLRKDQWRPSGEAFVTFDSIKSAVSLGLPRETRRSCFAAGTCIASRPLSRTFAVPYGARA